MDQTVPARTASLFIDIFKDASARRIFGHEASSQEPHTPFVHGFASRLDLLIRNPANHLSLFRLGYAALEAFLQSNVTGPPLDFDPEDVIFPRTDHACLSDLRTQMLASLSVQGEAVSTLTPHIELFWVAKSIMSSDGLYDGFNGRRARMRVNFWHQKLLSEPSDDLREQIYQDADVLEGQLTSRLRSHGADAEFHNTEFLIERAVIEMYYGNDIKARTHLAQAAKVRGFDFALTGALGKRTKFQDRDISQLVVLARSKAEEAEEPSSRKGSRLDSPSGESSMIDSSSKTEPLATPSMPPVQPQKQLESPAATSSKKPENILLNDDTLLESIHFAPPKLLPEIIPDNSALPSSLVELDPSSQPLLHPFDSIILLQVASSISNTSPSDGLTREETLPYATRVLEGGSSNWQVYTQALLVRSRIEGYRSRTAERGLLQLQALVDQVIVETSTRDFEGVETGNASLATLEEKSPSPSQSPSTAGPASFLPSARSSESAPVAERLKYIYQIHPPLRLELEAELAARWVSMGGLKTALDIYERLQMYAEVALCLAATNNETKAARVIRKLVFEPKPELEGEKQEYTGPELATLPPDAPRLYCILGDLENSPQHYERAWTVSKGRYARAQRSLGRFHIRNNNYRLAAEAYAKSLEVNRLNASTWFALGCAYLELEEFKSAVESFTRTVQLEGDDAEAWSNLAAALLRLPRTEEEGEEDAHGGDEKRGVAAAAAVAAATQPAPTSTTEASPDENSATASPPPTPKPSKHLKDALVALRRAAHLKHSDARIWDNYLTVAASIPPPYTAWSEILLAQKRLLELRGKTAGEAAVDEKILTVLVRYVTREFVYPRREKMKTKTKTDKVAVGAGATTTRGDNDAAQSFVAEEEEEGMEIGITDQQQQQQQQLAPHHHPPNNTDNNTHNPSPFPRGSIPALLLTLFDAHITPLLTHSVPLYLLLSDVNLWRHRPRAALQAQEKAWRALMGRVPAVFETEEGWEEVVEMTVRLVRDGYLGVGGLEVGDDEGEREMIRGERVVSLVARDGRFKARSAVRAVMGRGRAADWEGSRGWERLARLAEELKRS